MTSFEPMPVAEPALETRGLWKRYRRGRWALQDIDLEIKPGRFVALVGPNGAGKSTLLRTWLGFEKATRGTVLAAGVDPWRHRGAALGHLGYIPQQPALYDELTVEEHVDLAAYLRRGLDRAGALERIDELELPRRSRADELSGGQRAQLGLALVLATGAGILLLDEPLASLDPLARRSFLDVLARETRVSGTTVVISSHIVRDIEDACEDVLILIGGRVRFHASVDVAKASHRVVSATDAGARQDEVIGVFPADGAALALLRHEDAAATVGRAPSLEELVLGYLAGDTASRREPPVGSPLP